MSFQSTAQTHELPELIVIDPNSMEDSMSENSSTMHLQPIEVVDDSSVEHEVHDETPSHNGDRRDPYAMEVSEGENGPGEIIIELSDLPGAPPGTPPPQDEPTLEVSEDDGKSKEDDNDASKKKNKLKWNFEENGVKGFIPWLKQTIENVPKHSGYDISGIHRAISFLEAIDNEVSRVMRLDLDGELDASQVESIRSKIDDGLAALYDRADKVNKHSKNKRRKKKSSDEETSGIIKEAQKVTGVQGTFVTVPLLISGIARTCVNSTVSGGHDLADIFERQCSKYKLNEREKSEVRWLLLDMGMYIRGDRGFNDGDDYDTTSSNNYDFGANYTG